MRTEPEVRAVLEGAEAALPSCEGGLDLLIAQATVEILRWVLGDSFADSRAEAN